jgi:hypothetical protein
MDTHDKPIFSAMSGSVGDTVHARNPTGQYTRPRVIPFDPATAFQVVMRDHMADISPRWTTDLSDAQRLAWRRYAKCVPLPSRIGGLAFISGQSMFVRNNMGRARPRLGLRLDAPSHIGHGAFHAPIYNNLLGPGIVTVIFDTTDEWVTETGAGLIIQISDTQPLTHNFFKGPYRFAAVINGDDTTPPTSPRLVFDPWPIGAPGRKWGRARVARDDGRLSQPIRTEFTGLGP